MTPSGIYEAICAVNLHVLLRMYIRVVLFVAFPFVLATSNFVGFDDHRPDPRRTGCIQFSMINNLIFIVHIVKQKKDFLMQ